VEKVGAIEDKVLNWTEASINICSIRLPTAVSSLNTDEYRQEFIRKPPTNSPVKASAELNTSIQGRSRYGDSSLIA
jgi:hypothetical protein